jgi:hypothetical protein
LLKAANIPNSLLYFSRIGDKMHVVDAMISANKFVGPGMLRDLFGKIMPTQSVVSIDVMNDDNIKKYAGKFIKPSAFKYYLEDNNPRPLYGIL